MLDRLTPVRRNLALFVLLVLVLWFAWTVRAALNPLLLAFLFAYMLHPMVLTLERRGWSRKRAVNVIYGATALTAILATVGILVQGRQLIADLAREDGLLPRVEAGLVATYQRAEQALDEWMPEALSPDEEEPPAEGSEPLDPAEETPSLSAAFLAEARAWITSDEGLSAARQAGTVAAGLARRLFGSLLSFLTLAFLVPVYTWFLLFELERIARWISGYVPVDQRDRLAGIGDQIAEVLGSFFRGRILVCLLKGAMLWILLLVLGVPYAFLLGLLSGFLSLIPFVGPFFGYGLVFLLSLTMGSAPAEPGGAGELAVFGAVWRTVVVFSVGELVEGYVLLPRILGDSLGLHPLVVLVSLTVAGASLGMFGLLLALPLTAAVIIVAKAVVLPAVKDWADGRRERAAPPAVT